ncbi:hypothetical protein IFR09_04895 [Pseudomonas syringae]|nr:hypothetical protein [Pseudomonas syringae]MBD8791733.1 hypothetical protein [Pseudomonas syringae]MBD8801093.1 hypothetical protein [Pseudomonas syringae]MBD8810497.1 hypothetical protein [Pseudomonas syringae]
MRTASNPNIKAPVIPAAKADGLIKLSDLTHDLDMHFSMWEGLEPYDAYQLAFNGLTIGPLTRFTDPVPGALISLTIPLALLQSEGNHRIAYRVTSYPGGDVFDSPATIIRIDRTAPGAALLAPLIFPHTQDTLTAHIPGYAGMAAGDTLQSFCNGVPGPVHIISDDDLSTRLMQIDFSRKFLQGLSSAEIEFTYHVTDRAANQSRLARPVRLTAKFENLPTPT